MWARYLPLCNVISQEGAMIYVIYVVHMDVGQNPVPPVNLKVDGHPLYHMISRVWPIPTSASWDFPKTSSKEDLPEIMPNLLHGTCQPNRAT